MANDLQIHPDVKKNYKCKQYGYYFNRPSTLKTHMMVHSGKKPIVCAQCNYSCNKAGAIESICEPTQGKSLIGANSASIPVQLQVISRSTCSLRGKKHSVTLSSPIPAQQVVQQHMTTYSGEKHFSCAQCKYSCNNAGGLKKHMRHHSGEKSFACNQCNLSYRDSSGLRYHRLSHTGEKPFACNNCGTSYKQSIL